MAVDASLLYRGTHSHTNRRTTPAKHRMGKVLEAV